MFVFIGIKLKNLKFIGLQSYNPTDCDVNYCLGTEHLSVNSIKKLITEPGQIFKRQRNLKNSLKRSEENLHSKMISYENLNFIKLTAEEFVNFKREKIKTMDLKSNNPLNLVKNRGGLKSDSYTYDFHKKERGENKVKSLDSKIDNAFNPVPIAEDKINNISIISMDFSEKELDEQRPTIRKDSDEFLTLTLEVQHKKNIVFFFL